jgi:hypothetical protein
MGCPRGTQIVDLHETLGQLPFEIGAVEESPDFEEGILHPLDETFHRPHIWLAMAGVQSSGASR